MATRNESMADITISIGDETDVVVEELTLNKTIEVDTKYGSGRTLPDAYSVDEISYDGSMELDGNKIELEDELFDDDGIPVESTITVTHFNGESTSYTQVLATSEGYEGSAGESTTTTFEFLAMGKESHGSADQEPTN